MKHAWLILFLSGCALTNKADALDIRYFTPEHVRPRLTGAADARGPALRLGRVTSGLHLREPIAYRDGTYEVGYYEDRRWTERPDLYVRRELGRVLFEEHGFRRVVSGDAPTLDVEVIAFEEVKTRELHAARVVVRVLLVSDRVLLEDTITVDEPVAASAPIDEVVSAMARALDGMSDRVAREVGQVL